MRANYLKTHLLLIFCTHTEDISGTWKFPSVLASL